MARGMHPWIVSHRARFVNRPARPGARRQPVAEGSFSGKTAGRSPRPPPAPRRGRARWSFGRRADRRWRRASSTVRTRPGARHPGHGGPFAVAAERDDHGEPTDPNGRTVRPGGWVDPVRTQRFETAIVRGQAQASNERRRRGTEGSPLRRRPVTTPAAQARTPQVTATALRRHRAPSRSRSGRAGVGCRRRRHPSAAHRRPPGLPAGQRPRRATRLGQYPGQSR